jgi:dTDP-glucose pyrophosphorylase
MGFINEEQLKKEAEILIKSGYGKYLYDVLKKGRD